MTKELAQTFSNDKLLELYRDYSQSLSRRFSFEICDALDIVKSEILNRMTERSEADGRITRNNMA